MTLPNRELAERFARGDHTGNASRMEIRPFRGFRCVVGYGWAVYAADIDGDVVLFGDGYATDGSNVGWAGYSGTTTKHLQILKGALETVGGAFTVADARPQTRPRGMSEATTEAELREMAEEQTVEPQEYTGYHYRKQRQ